MPQNAYVPPQTDVPALKTRGKRWAVRSGIACLVLAAICAALTVAGMVRSFQRIAESSSTPSPADLAEGIRLALIPSYGVVPLAILGIVLVVVGLRRAG